MSVKKVIEIETKVDDDGLNKLDKGLKNTEKSSKKLEKQQKQTTKATKGIGGAIKGVGVAFKALGIGIVVAAFAKLGDILSKNQKVIDFFASGMEFVSLAVKSVSDALFNAFNATNEATGGFDALGRVVQNIIKIALTPLKLSFLTIKQAIQAANLAYQNVFGDSESVKEARQALQDTANQLKETVTGAIQAGTAITKDFSEAVDEVKEGYKSVTEEISKIDVKKLQETAKENVRIANAAKIAAVEQQRLVEQYDREAELKRQIRDDDRISIPERIKANNELAAILDKQEKALLRQADLQVQKAKNDLAINDNIENQVALTEALANKEGILAQVEGFRSEQKANDVALDRERLQLQQSLTDAEKERQIAQAAFEASRETDPLKKIEKEREALELEKQIEQERLNNKILLFQAETQARVDAEIELANKLQEIDNQITAKKEEEAAKRKEITKEQQKTELARQKEEKRREQALGDFKIGVAFNVLGAIQSLAKENSALAKGIAIAQAVLSTYQGINKALAETTDFTPSQTLRFANAAAVGITGFANVAKILSTDSTGANSPQIGGGGVSGSQTAQAPSFNVVGTSGVNQLAETLNQEQQPLKAFVVSSEISNQQELDNNITDTATIG